jgi:hypothetical protein
LNDGREYMMGGVNQLLENCCTTELFYDRSGSEYQNLKYVLL